MHKTVLLDETIDHLQIKETGTYVDLTLGGGGHSLKIIKNLKKGVLMCFDIDPEAVKNFASTLKEIGFTKETKLKEEGVQKFNNKKEQNTVYLINNNFTQLNEVLKKLDLQSVDGIISDLGWSSDQLGNIPGLSYENELEELDMRFSEKLGVKASDLLNALGRKQLQKMFEMYADIYGVQNSKLVEEINKFKKSSLINTVGDLLKIIDKAYRFNNADRFRKNDKYKAYSRIFQALRIAVNDEITNLKEMVQSGFENLKKDGNFLVITFHSGEEKVVNGFFQDLVANQKAKFITEKFGEISIRPTVDELKENLRSRSSKLFGIKKI